MTGAAQHQDIRGDMPGPRPGFFDLTPGEVQALLTVRGEPAFRARQIFDWVYARGATRYAEMSNLPAALRSALDAELPLYESEVIREQKSRDGTVKLLLRWRDGTTSECVMIPDEARRTACISTQVGCPVGCRFCASGIGGLERNLSAGQIVEQAMRVRAVCAAEAVEPAPDGGEGQAPLAGARLSNVVFMGLGEPLANYQATLRALRALNADWGMGIGARRMTISTVGLPRQMRMLADEGLQITLALSLHAPSDELRRRIIPWAERIGVDELVAAGRYYFERTGREITIEYILLAGVNDGDQQVEQLSAITRRMRSHVNLIAYNPVEGLGFARPSPAGVQRFVRLLRERGVNIHVRRSRGLDIDGACGQLRRREREQTVRLTLS